jgi:hypothetical protein
MSYAHTAPATEEVAGADRTGSLLRWIVSGTSAAAILAAAAIAFWPASEADEARDDGEQVGTAVNALYAADTPEEVDAALADINVAVSDTADHAGDAVYDQLVAQEDALSRAAEGFVGYYTTDDAWDQELYEWELDTAVSDLESNAEDFRTTGPEVQQAFWDGYDSTVNAS